MEKEYNFNVSPFPPFGSWNIEYMTFVEEAMYEDRDLYVAGDLYENYYTTPTVIAVPRRKRNEVLYTKENEETKGEWLGSCELKAPPSPVPAYLLTPPVEEDLYKVSPGIIRVEDKRRARSFFSSCLRPDCLC